MQKCLKSGWFGDIYCQGFDFDPVSVAKGTILALGLRSKGYGCEKPGPHMCG